MCFSTGNLSLFTAPHKCEGKTEVKPHCFSNIVSKNERKAQEVGRASKVWQLRHDIFQNHSTHLPIQPLHLCRVATATKANWKWNIKLCACVCVCVEWCVQPMQASPVLHDAVVCHHTCVKCDGEQTGWQLNYIHTPKLQFGIASQYSITGAVVKASGHLGPFCMGLAALIISNQQTAKTTWVSLRQKISQAGQRHRKNSF